MSVSEEKLNEEIKKLKNKQMREWREKNKDKVKAINERYWINRAKKLLEKGE